MFAWEKVLIEKVVFKGRDKVMAEEIQPQRGFFFSSLVPVVGRQGQWQMEAGLNPDSGPR